MIWKQFVQLRKLRGTLSTMFLTDKSALLPPQSGLNPEIKIHCNSETNFPKATHYAEIRIILLADCECIIFSYQTLNELSIIRFMSIKTYLRLRMYLILVVFLLLTIRFLLIKLHFAKLYNVFTKYINQLLV